MNITMKEFIATRSEPLVASRIMNEICGLKNGNRLNALSRISSHEHATITLTEHIKLTQVEHSL